MTTRIARTWSRCTCAICARRSTARSAWSRSRRFGGWATGCGGRVTSSSGGSPALRPDDGHHEAGVRAGFARPLSRLPIRARLAAAFALAMVLVLAGAGVFVYLRLRADLDETIDSGLRSRADDVAALIQQPDAGLTSAGGERLAESEESFAQVLTPNGRLVDATPGVGTPALAPAQAADVSGRGTLFERRLP